MLGGRNHIRLAGIGHWNALGRQRVAQAGGAVGDGFKLTTVQQLQAVGNLHDLAQHQLGGRAALALNSFRQSGPDGIFNEKRAGEKPHGKNENSRQNRPDGDIGAMITRKRMQGGKLAFGAGHRPPTAGKKCPKANDQNDQKNKRSAHRYVPPAHQSLKAGKSAYFGRSGTAFRRAGFLTYIRACCRR